MGEFRATAESEQDRVGSRSRSGRRSRRRRSVVSRAIGDNGEIVASWLLILAIAGSAQAIGAVHVPVLLIVAGIGLLACAIAYRARLVSDWLIPPPGAIFL